MNLLNSSNRYISRPARRHAKSAVFFRVPLTSKLASWRAISFWLLVTIPSVLAAALWSPSAPSLFVDHEGGSHLTRAHSILIAEDSNTGGDAAACPAPASHQVHCGLINFSSPSSTQPGDGLGFIVRRMRVTAYCPCEICCGRFADGVTASGHVIKPDDTFCAADKDLAFGTLVSVPGYCEGRPVPVLDHGGAITGDRLDVFFPTHEQALEWGVRIVDCKLYIGNE